MATDLDARNVPDIANAELFDSDVEIALLEAGAFKYIASVIFRQIFSTSLFKHGTAAPGASDIIANTTVFYIRTTGNRLYVSLVGADFIEVAGGSQTGLTAEQVRDAVAAFLREGTGISITHDDDGDTLTIASTVTDTNTQLTDEQLQDKIAAFLTEGSNVSITYDDNAGTLTIAATGTGGGGLTVEQVRDAVAAFIQEGIGITVTHDDTADTLTIGSNIVIVQAVGPPSNSDAEAGKHKIWVDYTRNAIYLSFNGANFEAATETERSVGQVDNFDGMWAIGSGGNPGSGEAKIADASLKISVADSDGMSEALTLSRITIGDRLNINAINVFRVTAVPALRSDTPDYYEFSGVWERRVDTEVVGETTHIGVTYANRAVGVSAVKDYHIAANSVGFSELKNNPENADKFMGFNASGETIAKDAPETELTNKVGIVEALGAWRRHSSISSGQYTAVHHTTPGNIVELEINVTNRASQNKQTTFQALQADDMIVVHTSQFVNALTVATVSVQNDIADITGTWQESGSFPGDFPTGSDATFYLIKSYNRVGDNAPQPGRIVGVGADYNLEYVENPQGQGGEDDATEVVINSGIYNTLGSWDRGSASIPDTGDYYTEATQITLNPQDNGDTNRAEAIEGLAAGDRIQFGAINAFTLTAAPTQVNGWSLIGTWDHTYAAADFSGVQTLYYIKKNNIVAHGNVVPGRYLKIGSDLMIEAEEADARHAKLLWGAPGSGGIITTSQTTTYNLNAGEKFSNYRDIYVEYDARNEDYPPVSHRNFTCAVFPSALWAVNYQPRVELLNFYKEFKVITDASFQIFAGNSETDMHIRAIYGGL